MLSSSARYRCLSAEFKPKKCPLASLKYDSSFSPAECQLGARGKGVGEGAGVGGDAGADGSMLRGMAPLVDVDSLIVRACDMLGLDLALRILSI